MIKTSLRSFCFTPSAWVACATAVFPIAIVSMAEASSTQWTGATNSLVGEPLNWTAGVPTSATDVILSATDATRVTLQGNATARSLTFAGTTEGTPLNYHWTVPGTLNVTDRIDVLAGSGAHTIDATTGYQIRFSGMNVAPGDRYITNNSANLLTLTTQLNGFSDQGHVNIHFDGSGDTIIAGTIHQNTAVNQNIRRVQLDPTMSGTLTIGSGLLVRSNVSTYVYGGTLAMDGDIVAQNSELRVAGEGASAVLTGNGRIGVQPSATSNAQLSINMYDGAVVSAGRIGETGALQFLNSDVSFRAGSTIHVDLLSPNDHDQLLFAREDLSGRSGGGSNLKLPAVDLVTTGDGVELALNFLGGAPVLGNYTILSGYDALTGRFVGWDHEVERTLDGFDGYSFSLYYGAHQTVLTVIPEPKTYALIGGVVALLAIGLRRRK